MTLYAIRSIFTPGRPKPPEKDLAYERWIRTLPCVACGSTRRIECMHTGPRGIGQKAPSKQCLPGCESCHRTGPKAYHKLGRRDWEAVHQIDIEEQIKWHNHLWELKQGEKAA